MHFPFVHNTKAQDIPFSHPTGPTPYTLEPTPVSPHLPGPTPIETSLSPMTQQPEPTSSDLASSSPLALIPSSSAPQLRRSIRTKRPPSHLADYYCNLSLNLPSKSLSRCVHPLASVLTYSRLSPHHKHYMLSLSTETKPASY